MKLADEKELKKRSTFVARLHRRALRRAAKKITGGLSGNSRDRRKQIRAALKDAA